MNAAEPSLVAEMERIWGLRPRVEITLAERLDWGGSTFRTRQVARKEAASVLRDARNRGAYIERSEGGFYIEEPK